MADLTSNVQTPGVTGAAPVYAAVSANDFFAAQPGSRYILHYKNGATPTGAGTFLVTDPTTPVPPGSSASAGFADAVTKSNAIFAASAELIVQIPNSNRHRDNQGRINLVHNGGSLTTVTVCIMGPFPA